MFWISRFLARRVWYGMLWFMRRPAIKTARRNFPNLFPERYRAKIWEDIKAHDLWAMRHGRKILTFMFNVLILTFLMSYIVLVTLELHARGAFGFLEAKPGQSSRSGAKVTPQ